MLQLKSKTGEKRQTSSELMDSTLSNNHFYACVTRKAEHVYSGLCISVCKRISLCVPSSPRESGKNDTTPQHPVRPRGHSSESLLPQTHFKPFVNTLHFDMITGSGEDVFTCR